jgi:hypothetical protein
MNVKVAEAQRLIIGPMVLLAGALLAMADADGLVRRNIVRSRSSHSV